MPHFTKQEHQLESRLDKWLYFIKHLEDFQSIPMVFKDEVFIQAFEKAEIAKYSPAELHDYEQSLKIYRDLKGAIDTAFFDGKVAVATKMKAKGMDVESITELTGLPKEELDKL